MSKENLLELRFAKDEFIMLSFALGGKKILGMENRVYIQKNNSDGLQAKWQKVKRTLKEKHYIGDETQNSVEIDVAVYFLLSIIINPNGIFSIKVTEENILVHHSYFYINNEGIVAVLFNSDDSEIIVKLYNNVSDIIEEIKSFFYTQSWAKNTSEDSFEIVTAFLNKSKYDSFLSALNLNNLIKTQDILVLAGMEREYADDAVKGFLNKKRFLSFSCITKIDDRENTEVLMFYFGERFFWSIEAISQDDWALKFTKLSLNTCFESMIQLLISKSENLMY